MKISDQLEGEIRVEEVLKHVRDVAWQMETKDNFSNYEIIRFLWGNQVFILEQILKLENKLNSFKGK